MVIQWKRWMAIEIHLDQWGTHLLVGFTNSYWVNDPDDRNSIVGYFFSLGLGPTTWDCKKQQDITLSIAESEYQVEYNAS